MDVSPQETPILDPQPNQDDLTAPQPTLVVPDPPTVLLTTSDPIVPPASTQSPVTTNNWKKLPAIPARPKASIPQNLSPRKKDSGIKLTFDLFKYDAQFWRKETLGLESLILAPAPSSPRKSRQLRRAESLQVLESTPAPLSQLLIAEIAELMEPEKKLDTKKRVAAYTNLSFIRFHQLIDETKDDTLKHLVHKQEAILYQEFTEAIMEVSNVVDDLFPAFFKITSGGHAFPQPLSDLSEYLHADQTLDARKFGDQFCSQVNFNYSLHEGLKLNDFERSLRRLKKIIVHLNEGPFITAFAPLKEELELIISPLQKVRDLLQDALTALTDHLDFCHSVLESIHIESFHSKYRIPFQIQNIHHDKFDVIFGGSPPQSYPITCPSLGELNEEVIITNSDQYKMLRLNYEMTQGLMERMGRSLPINWPSYLPNLTTHDGHPRVLLASPMDFILVQGNYSDFIARMVSLKKDWQFCLKEIFELLGTDLKKEPTLWTIEEVQNWIKGFPPCAQYSDNFKSIDGEALVQLDLEQIKKLEIPASAALPLHMLIRDLVPRKCEIRIDSPTRKLSKNSESFGKHRFNKEPRALERKQKRVGPTASIRVYNVLLLGITGSGKTTFFNQIRREDVTSTEFKALQQPIRSDIRSMVSALAESFDFRGHYAPIPGPTYEDHIKQITNSDWAKARASISVLVKLFISVPSFMETIPKTENYTYFLSNQERILQPDFLPNHVDLVNFSFPTITQNSASVESNQVILQIQDLGGKRSERQYWIPKFVGVSGIAFFVDLDAYNETLPKEEGGLPVFEETTRLFKKLTSAQYFAPTPFIVVLNKVTNFAQKIKKVPFRDYFPDFPDPAKSSDFEACLTFIKSQFITLFKGQEKSHLMFVQADVIKAESASHVLGVLSDFLSKKVLPSEYTSPDSKARGVASPRDFFDSEKFSLKSKSTSSIWSTEKPKHVEHSLHNPTTPRGLTGAISNPLREKKHMNDSQSLIGLVKQQEEQIRNLTQKLKDAENKTQSVEIERLNGVIEFRDEEIRRLEADLSEKCALIGGLVTDKKLLQLLKEKDAKIKSVEKQLDKERRQAQEIQNKTLLWLAKAPNMTGGEK